MSTLLAFLLLSFVAACTSERTPQPAELDSVSENQVLKYDFTPGSTYTYRYTTDRNLYGTSSGEAHEMRLKCREKSGDVQTFELVDSLLYTTSLNTRFPGKQRKVSSFRMTSRGEAPGAGTSLLAAAQPLVPLPGLPEEELELNKLAQEEIPYTHFLAENSRLVVSTRQRTLYRAPDDNGMILREEILQVIETDYPLDDQDTALVRPALRASITGSDTLAVTREIVLSGMSGHLVRSSETEREVRFVPSATTGSGSPGRYTVNETVTDFELIAHSQSR